MTDNRKQLTHRFRTVTSRLYDAAQSVGRDPATVTLLAVSKARAATELRLLYELGQRDFGESYLQEALAKMATLRGSDIRWHFIGPIQANKTRAIAEHFSWAHSVDRPRIAYRLNEQRPTGLPPLNICLQVNISAEASKSGVAPDALAELAAVVARLPMLRLRGLMAIPPPCNIYEQQRLPFAYLCQLYAELRCNHSHIDTLSMGMTNDLEAAVAEGSTLVRIGTALFGSRETSALQQASSR